MTAFSTQDGHWRFNKLPFGVKNGPFLFSKIMKELLGHLPFCQVYLDDIVIHSSTIESHIKHIRAIAKILEEAKLKINPEKCTWLATKIKFLGHVVSGDQISMDMEKINEIMKRAPPRNVKEVQQFLGSCNFYRKFITDFAKMTQPLTTLLKSDVKFDMNAERLEAFNTLKKLLASYPILQQIDPSRELRLTCDASDYAIGSILGQRDDQKREYSNNNSSRLLTDAERNYTVSEKELLAIIFGIKANRMYLMGRKFTIVTDHSALIWLLSLKDPTARLARWAIYLQAYDFDIEHRAGIKNSNADYISRPVLVMTRSSTRQLAELRTNNQEEDSTGKILDVYEDVSLMRYLRMGRHADGMAKKHVKRIEKLAQNLLSLT